MSNKILNAEGKISPLKICMCNYVCIISGVPQKKK